jgi:calcineurin-like phosphoesterase family protein
MSNIWISSDFHYGHKNISSKNESQWKTGYRNFNSLKEHNEIIVKNINKSCQENDILYCLGDWSFGGVENIWNFRKQLNCKNIHLILGNHDHHIEDGRELKIPDADEERLHWLCNINDVYEQYNGYMHISADKLFTSVQHVAQVKLGGQNIFMSHYSHRIWLGSHKGYLHLYGHSHASIPDYGKSMDVGVDAAYKHFGEYRPFNLNEILLLLSEREIEFPDHHSTETNVK